ncbi:hypothetical protein [Venatoribacter cucullus]|uniref:hypothetical protein n=1 Tax=Venatoribacter cucullus TaxID=2661630 RepID=UPI002240A113|nr:hypothetical protein [Venatoribacter cucullus]UZK03535.1 hypothetical protein GAY96_06325 [Venatoribacter cucullus]
MANVKLKEEDQILLQGEAVNISPLGFDCEISLDAIPSLRDAAGRFRMLGMELQLLAHKGAVTVCGSASVYSVRRVAQNTGLLTVRFADLQQDAYRLIAEHLSPVDVVSLEQARHKRRA